MESLTRHWSILLSTFYSDSLAGVRYCIWRNLPSLREILVISGLITAEHQPYHGKIRNIFDFWVTVPPLAASLTETGVSEMLL